MVSQSIPEGVDAKSPIMSKLKTLTEEIEFVGSSNKDQPVSIEGVSQGKIKVEGEIKLGYLVNFKVGSVEKVPTINEQLYSALKLVFDLIKEQNQPELFKWMNSGPLTKEDKDYITNGVDVEVGKV